MGDACFTDADLERYTSINLGSSVADANRVIEDMDVEEDGTAATLHVSHMINVVVLCNCHLSSSDWRDGREMTDTTFCSEREAGTTDGCGLEGDWGGNSLGYHDCEDCVHCGEV